MNSLAKELAERIARIRSEVSGEEVLSKCGEDLKFLLAEYDAAAALIDSALPKWVEVSERLPENGQRVLAAIPTWKGDGTWWGYILETATFKAGEFLFESDTPESEDVSHWQPETTHPAAPSTDEKEGS